MTAGVTMEASVDELQVAAVYADCHHTKYVGCRPCIHDETADRVAELETPRRLAINALAREAQELGLYDATDDPVNRPVRG